MWNCYPSKWIPHSRAQAFSLFFWCSMLLCTSVQGTVLGWFVMGRVFDFAFSGITSDLSTPSSQELKSISTTLNQRLPIEIGDHFALVKAYAAGPKTLGLEFQWFIDGMHSVEGAVFDEKIGLPLRDQVCQSLSYQNWLNRGGAIIFKFVDKTGSPIKEYWAEKKDCQF